MVEIVRSVGAVANEAENGGATFGGIHMFTRTTLGACVVIAGALLTATPAAANPSDGNGAKDVVSIAFGPLPGPTCDSGKTLTVQGDGWFQGFESPTPDGNRYLGHAVFHLDITFSNATGETWVWRDRGPDRFYLVDDVPYVVVTGRSTGSGVVGQVVVNLATGEVIKVAGNPLGDGGPLAVDAAACDALT